MHIRGVDIGTTGMKMGVFRGDGGSLPPVRQFTRSYAVNTYHDGLFSDIEPEKWRQAFCEGCRSMGDLMGWIDAIALSGTTPGETAMDADGEALYPAILMLDQRSSAQAERIIETVGRDSWRPPATCRWRAGRRWIGHAVTKGAFGRMPLQARRVDG